MSIHPPIYVRFIRKEYRDATDKKHDDTLSITYSSESSVRVVFRDAVSKSKHVATLGHTDFQSYFESLTALLYADKEPFWTVQVDFPLMPSVLLKPSALLQNSVADALHQSFRRIFANWPVSESEPVYDSDDDTEDDASSTTVSTSDDSSEDEEEETVEDGEVPPQQTLSQLLWGDISASAPMEMDEETDSDMPALLPQEPLPRQASHTAPVEYDRLVNAVRHAGNVTTPNREPRPLTSGSMNQTTYNAYLGMPYGNSTYTNSLAYYFPTEPASNAR